MIWAAVYERGTIMIRFLLVAVIVIGFLILSIPVLIVEWIIGKFSPMTKEISSLRLIQGAFKFILWVAGTKITVIGEENVPKDTPVLYIGNHRSYFDILLTYSRCPIRTGYVAKKRNGKDSSSVKLDEISALSVS